MIVRMLEILRSVNTNQSLILKLVKMDIASRYTGSVLGFGWLFFQPILMLTIYTFVFSFVFNARWDHTVEQSRSEFALILFAGLIIHGFLAEILNRSPNIILTNVNYVKKVVFPIEILSVVNILSTTVTTTFSIMILVIGNIIFNQSIYITVLLIPIVLFPFCFLMLGMSWILASLGVYVRDIAQFTGILTTMLLFLSPIFYPLSTLPEQLQWAMLFLNPLTFIVEETRAILLFDKSVNWLGLLLYTTISLIFMKVGFEFFQKTRRGFSDVL